MSVISGRETMFTGMPKAKTTKAAPAQTPESKLGINIDAETLKLINMKPNERRRYQVSVITGAFQAEQTRLAKEAKKKSDLEAYTKQREENMAKGFSGLIMSKPENSYGRSTLLSRSVLAGETGGAPQGRRILTGG